MLTLGFTIDWIGASYLGSGFTINTSSGYYHPERHTIDSSRGYMLGKLHAPPPTESILPKRQHIPRSHGRRSGHLVITNAHRRSRRAMFRALRQPMCPCQRASRLDYRSKQGNRTRRNSQESCCLAITNTGHAQRAKVVHHTGRST